MGYSSYDKLTRSPGESRSDGGSIFKYTYDQQENEDSDQDYYDEEPEVVFNDIIYKLKMIQDRDDIFMSWVPKDRDINTLEGFESWRQAISDQEYENIQENCDNLSEQNYDFRIETLESIPIKNN